MVKLSLISSLILLIYVSNLTYGASVKDLSQIINNSKDLNNILSEAVSNEVDSNESDSSEAVSNEVDSNESDSSENNVDRREILESLTERLEQSGATSGPIQISLLWNNINDLDLWVYDPFDDRICWFDTSSASGGFLDVDANSFGTTNTPIENIVWPSTYPSGEYKVYVDFYEFRGVDYSTNFTLVIKRKNNYKIIQEVLIPTDREKFFYSFIV